MQKVEIKVKEPTTYIEINELVSRLLHLKQSISNEILLTVLNTPTTEIIRCKNCAYHHNSERNLWCDIFDKIMPEDGFCSLGEECKE